MLKKTPRRFFLKQAGASVLATAAHPLYAAEDPVPVDLGVVQGKIQPALEKALQLVGGIEKFIKPNSTVLLKPNISFPNPEIYASTTNPQVVRAMAQIVLNAGAKRVIVADHTMRDPSLCFKRTGIQAALEELENVKLLALDKDSLYEEVPVDKGQAIKKLKICKLLQRADVVINMPCAKSHVATDVSFGLKNLMGLIWDREYFHSGTDLHTAIAELATVIKPHLTILDATRALETNGPTGPGKVQELNTIVAGVDPLAVDAFALDLANWNNRVLTATTVKHLSHAIKLEIGQADLTKLNIIKTTV
ncbi:DUF362 domain-containing protein [candidate division KSB1 bacterium]|nr:DUF362 domain-containing protein [candidate division KSB1 bacterium]